MPEQLLPTDNTLRNRIPTDENQVPVAVLYTYNEASGTYSPVSGGAGGSLTVTDTVQPLKFIIMHDEKTISEPTVPLSKQGVNMTGFKKMRIDIRMDAPNSYVNLIPLAWNPIYSGYQLGQEKAFNQNYTEFINVEGAEDIYLLPSVISGTISVIVAGV